MKRLDNRLIPEIKDEIRLFIVGRNESLRLPYFFEYYRAIGVQRFFYIDNDSQDDSRDYLLSQPDVHVWLQTQKYIEDNKFGVAEELLKVYGVGHWCLLADLDELFIYPYKEKRSLRDFVQDLDLEGASSAL